MYIFDILHAVFAYEQRRCVVLSSGCLCFSYTCSGCRLIRSDPYYLFCFCNIRSLSAQAKPMHQNAHMPYTPATAEEDGRGDAATATDAAIVRKRKLSGGDVATSRPCPISIQKKLEIIDFYDSIPPNVCNRAKRCIEHFPETLGPHNGRCRVDISRWRYNFPLCS